LQFIELCATPAVLSKALYSELHFSHVWQQGDSRSFGEFVVLHPFSSSHKNSINSAGSKGRRCAPL